jgi:hypothetical protein
MALPVAFSPEETGGNAQILRTGADVVGGIPPTMPGGWRRPSICRIWTPNLTLLEPPRQPRQMIVKSPSTTADPRIIAHAMLARISHIGVYFKVLYFLEAVSRPSGTAFLLFWGNGFRA